MQVVIALHWNELRITDRIMCKVHSPGAFGYSGQISCSLGIYHERAAVHSNKVQSNGDELEYVNNAKFCKD